MARIDGSSEPATPAILHPVARIDGSSEPGGGRVIRVLVDVPAIDKTFDYVLPDTLAGATEVRLGTIVRVPLHGRRVGAWVVGINVAPAVATEQLRSVTKVSSVGPPRELLSLAKWAAHRWWGRPATFLQIASPNTTVRGFPPPPRFDAAAVPVSESPVIDSGELDAALRSPGTKVVRMPPLADVFPLLIAAVRAVGHDGLLVLAPHVGATSDLARRLRRAGVAVALLPDDWARAAVGGAVVIGARTAAWAPCARFGAAIVLDEHDEAYQDERAPTWHARDVVIERANRLNVACLLVSPVPSPHALAAANGHVLAPNRRAERDGWPVVELVDRTTEEPGRVPVVAPALTNRLRAGGRVVCVLNRTGRAKLLDCRACRTLAECERCGSALSLPSQGTMLVCGRCANESPIVCRACGGGRMRQLRPGTTRLREDLEALSQRPVAEVTGPSTRSEIASDSSGADRIAGAGNADVLIGTEAVLHRSGRADTVVFLDIDGELLAPRMRSADAVVALVVRAARLVGSTGRVVLVTRQAESPVLRALALADGETLSAELCRSLNALGYGPPAAVAVVSGAGAAAVGASLAASIDRPGSSIARIGPVVGPFVLTAPTLDQLSDALAAVERPADRVRVEIDPVRW